MIVFTPNTVIKSTEINSNFTDADTRLTTLESTITKKVMIIPYRWSLTGIQATFPNSSDQAIHFYFKIPEDYVSGDLTLKAWLRGDTSGVVAMYRNTFRFRENTAYLQIDNSVFTYITMSTGSILWTFTTGASNFVKGDVIRYDLHRDGANVNDTAASGEDLDGFWVEYTARKVQT